MTTKQLNRFLADFPLNATCWSQATDEIREMARDIRMTYNEMAEKEIQPLNFRSFSTPAEWNREARKQILQIWSKMDDRMRESILKNKNTGQLVEVTGVLYFRAVES